MPSTSASRYAGLPRTRNTANGSVGVRRVGHRRVHPRLHDACGAVGEERDRPGDDEEREAEFAPVLAQEAERDVERVAEIADDAEADRAAVVGGGGFGCVDGVREVGVHRKAGKGRAGDLRRPGADGR